MTKRIIHLGNALVLWTLWATPALADAFRVDIVCDSPSGKGQGKIGGQGTVKIQVQGLPANEPFTRSLPPPTDEERLYLHASRA